MISINRAKTIILCYGGHSFAWPKQERQVMQQLLLDSKSLSDLQKQAQALDSFIGFSEQKNEASTDWAITQQCANSIMAILPEQQRTIKPISVTLIDKFHEMGRKTLNQVSSIALVASIVLIVLGLSNNFQFNNIKDDIGHLSLSEFMTLYVDDNADFNEAFIATESDEQLEILAFLEPQIMDDD